MKRNEENIATYPFICYAVKIILALNCQCKPIPCMHSVNCPLLRSSCLVLLGAKRKIVSIEYNLH